MVVLALAVLVMVSAVTLVTVVAQRGSVLPSGQLFPAAAEVTVLARIPLPVSGLPTFTV